MNLTTLHEQKRYWRTKFDLSSGDHNTHYYYYFNRQILFSCLISTFAHMLCKEFRQLFSLKGRIMTDNKEHFSGRYSLSCATPQGEQMKYLYYKSVSVMWERWHYIWKLHSFSGLFIVTFITVLRQAWHLMLMVDFTGQINDVMYNSQENLWLYFKFSNKFSMPGRIKYRTFVNSGNCGIIRNFSIVNFCF